MVFEFLKELYNEIAGTTQVLEKKPFNLKLALESSFDKSLSIFKKAERTKPKLEIYGTFSASIERIKIIAEKGLKMPEQIQNKDALKSIINRCYSILGEVASYEDAKLDEKTSRNFIEQNLNSIKTKIENLDSANPVV